MLLDDFLDSMEGGCADERDRTEQLHSETMNFCSAVFSVLSAISFPGPVGATHLSFPPGPIRLDLRKIETDSIPDD